MSGMRILQDDLSLLPNGMSKIEEIKPRSIVNNMGALLKN